MIASATWAGQHISPFESTVRLSLPHVSGLGPALKMLSGEDSATFAVAYDSLPCPLRRMATARVTPAHDSGYGLCLALWAP